MDVLAFLMDVVRVSGSESKLALITVVSTDGAKDVLLLNEKQVQHLAMTVSVSTRNNTLSRLASLEHTGGKERAVKFLSARDMLSAGEFDLKNSIAIEVEPSVIDGVFVLRAVKASNTLFLANFDAFSAEAFVVSADDCFGQ